MTNIVEGKNREQNWPDDPVLRAYLNVEKFEKVSSWSVSFLAMQKLMNLKVKLGRSLSSVKFSQLKSQLSDERGDVPGWVLVVLMTTGLVTGIWTLAAPQIEEILRNSLNSMNGIR